MDELLERLSELEHVQWQNWSKSVSGDLKRLIELCDKFSDNLNDEEVVIEKVPVIDGFINFNKDELIEFLKKNRPYMVGSGQNSLYPGKMSIPS